MRKFLLYTFITTSTLLISSCSCNDKVEQKDIKIRHFGNFRKIFNDLNDKHLAAAKKWGVPEVKSREDAEKHKKTLKKIETCNYYKVANLTHSIPYLVPRAKDLLDDIGRSFNDSLKSHGVGSHQIIVTSVLRSNEDVKKLQRTNVNASDNSAHRYGTTVDIAYARFNRTDNKYPYDIPSEHLKHILSEVLRDLRKQERCYVKYEVKQGCYHITVR